MGINPILWGIAGLAVGWLATVLVPAAGATNRIESIAMALFGAYGGGSFLDRGTGPGAESFQPAALGLAVAGAVLMLVLLSVLRRAIGPLRPHKQPKRK